MLGRPTLFLPRGLYFCIMSGILSLFILVKCYFNFFWYFWILKFTIPRIHKTSVRKVSDLIFLKKTWWISMKHTCMRHLCYRHMFPSKLFGVNKNFRIFMVFSLSKKVIAVSFWVSVKSLAISSLYFKLRACGVRLSGSITSFLIVYAHIYYLWVPRNVMSTGVRVGTTASWWLKYVMLQNYCW